MPVSNSINYLYAQFYFTDDWNGLVKKAIFHYEWINKVVELDENDRCVIPLEVIKAPYMKVSCVGELNNQEMLVTSSPLIVNVIDNGMNEGTDTEYPLQEKMISLKGSYAEITPDSDFYGLSKVVVSVPQSDDVTGLIEEAKIALRPNKEMTINANGEYDTIGYKKAIVDVPLTLNGLIKEYKVARGNKKISVGDFVEYYKYHYERLEYTGSTTYSSCVAINENTVMAVYGSYVYLIKIKNEEITYTKKDTGINIYAQMRLVKIDDNKVFMAYQKDNSNYHLYGSVIEFDNENILSVTKSAISTTNRIAYYIDKCIKLPNGNIAILHCNDYEKQLYTIINILNDNSFTTVGNIGVLLNSNRVANDVLQISENKILTASTYGVFLIGIEENTLSILLSNTNTDTNKTGQSIVQLEENKYFISYSFANSQFYLYGIIAEITDSEIILTTTQLTSTSNSCNLQTSAVKLDDNIIAIYHYRSKSYYLYLTLVKVVDKTITIISNEKVEQANNSSDCYGIARYGNYNFIVYGGTYIKLCIAGSYLIKSTESDILGVSKTSGVAGDTIQVYVPKVESGNNLCI